MYDDEHQQRLGRCAHCLLAWLLVFAVAFTSVCFSIAWR